MSDKLLRNARVVKLDWTETDSGASLFRVIAHCDHFGEELLIAEFPFDDDDKFYEQRTKELAEGFADSVNKCNK